MPVIPANCDDGGGAPLDVENIILCDVLDGEVVGTALAVYDYSDGAPSGPPTFVDPITGDPYVAQGVLQPCGEAFDIETVELCDIQEGNATTRFNRHYVFNEGVLTRSFDTTLDGSVYAPLGTVEDCDTDALCAPSSNQDLNGECGPGEPVDFDLITEAEIAPDALVEDDPTADALCGGSWDRAATPEASPFPVNETFRNSTFDQSPAVTTGTAPYFLLTSSDGTDPVGEGWGRGSSEVSFTNGAWQIPTPFPSSPGMTAEITLASHTGTTPGGDGWVFAFTDGSVPPQSIPIGGGGGLGLSNWQGGYVGLVFDEYGGSTSPFAANTINLIGIGPNAATVIGTRKPTSPKFLNQTTRFQPARIRVSILTQFGQTFVSASVDWNDGLGFIQYFDRERVDDILGPAPATMRMGTSAASGGSFRAIKDQRDAVAHAAGIQQWRAFPITSDPIPDCTTLVTVEACVDLTFTSDSQTTGNSEPDAWLLLVNDTTKEILATARRTSTPNQVGQVSEMCVQQDVNPDIIPDLRVYVGVDTRDTSGAYSTLWENFTVTLTGTGCPLVPVRATRIMADCPIPVTIVGGGTGEGGGGGTTVVNTPATFEDLPICMDGAPAIRREVRSPDGNISVTFLGVDGVPIEPVAGWTPGACGDSMVTETEICYTTAPNQILSTGLMRTVYSPTGEEVSRTWLNASGNEMTEPLIWGPGACTSRDTEVFLGCLGGQTIEIRTTWLDGVLQTREFFDQAGDEIADPTGWTFGACPLPNSDTEVLTLCDEGNSNQSFVRRIVFNPDGTQASQTDLTFAGAPYIVVGPIVVCPGADTDQDIDVEQARICYIATSDPNSARRPGLLTTVFADGVETGRTFIDQLGDPIAEGDFTTWSVGDCPFDLMDSIVVCADGEPAIRYTLHTPVGTLTDEWFERDGGRINPGPTDWTAGQCVPEVPPSPQFVTTVTDNTAGFTITGADLVGWTLRNRNRAVGTYSLNGGTPVPFDVGESVSSGEVNEEGGLLTDTVTVALTSGSIRATVLRRV